VTVRLENGTAKTRRILIARLGADYVVAAVK
jgi:hypothetical protein